MNQNRDLPKRRFGSRLFVVVILLSGTAFLQSAQQAPPSTPPKANTADQDADNMPVGIRRHSKAFQESWRQIQAAIRRNESLKKPRPEPYLDRAELLAATHDHEGALKDCLAAVRIVRSSTNNLAEQARYLGLMEQALGRIVAAPERLYVADAREQFRLGRPLFFRGRDKAALARFDGAVKLNPKEPLFLYFRGLTLKRLGRDAEANSDVKRAVSLDVQELFGDSLHVSTRRLRENRSETFERIQGSLRAWMDSHFDGVPVTPSPDPEQLLPAK